MFVQLLNKEEADFCYNEINNDTFGDGNETQPISDIKKNKESQGVPDEVRKLIISKMYDTHYIDTVYCPNRVSVNYYNRYEEGDYYNLHVDNFKASPKSNNIFFDYGFTINLDDNYEGGEIFFETELGVISRKLEMGQAAIFPITYPHGVTKVTSGVRTNILGWMSSNISYQQYFILKNLYEVNQFLSQNKEAPQIFTKSVLVQNYLKKEWGK